MIDPFDMWNAKDGFHAVKVQFGSMLSVSCIHYINGEPASSESAAKFGTVPLIEIYEKYEPTPVEQGHAVRLQRLAEAIARYFTTGGTWDEFHDSVEKMRKVIPGGTVFPGYHLVDSYEATDGSNQHIYAKDGENKERKAVLWEQPTPNEAGGLVGGFVDPTTLDALIEREEENGWGTQEVEPEDAGEASLPNTLQLPARRSAVIEEEPQGSAGP